MDIKSSNTLFATLMRSVDGIVGFRLECVVGRFETKVLEKPPEFPQDDIFYTVLMSFSHADQEYVITCKLLSYSLTRLIQHASQ